jgi:hypothetical protein
VKWTIGIDSMSIIWVRGCDGTQGSTGWKGGVRDHEPEMERTRAQRGFGRGYIGNPNVPENTIPRVVFCERSPFNRRPRGDAVEAGTEVDR